MSLRRWLMRAYWRVEQVIVPGLQYSQLTYEQVLRQYVRQVQDWLDLGCGRRILPHWRREAEHGLIAGRRRVVGIDYDLASLRENRSVSARCRGDIAALPFLHSSLDLVSANMVVEHLLHPETQLREVWRVLRPGGVLIMHTPNAWGYPTLLARWVPDRPKRRLIAVLEGRKEEDVFPTHYRANTGPVLRRLASQTGFGVERLEFITSTAMTALILPSAVVELFVIRLLQTRRAKHLRPNIIAVFRKKPLPIPGTVSAR